MKGVKCRSGEKNGEIPIPLISIKAPSKPGDVWMAVNDHVAECKPESNVWAFGRSEAEAVLALGYALAKKHATKDLRRALGVWWGE